MIVRDEPKDPRCIVCGALMVWRAGKWACLNCGAAGC